MLHKKNYRINVEDSHVLGIKTLRKLSFFSLHRHALPLFTSLLNVVCAYDPVGYGIPYNHLLFSDYREQLVEQAVQILIVTLEHDAGAPHPPASTSSIDEQEVQKLPASQRFSALQ